MPRFQIKLSPTTYHFLLTMSRCLFMLLLPVAWTTATASCIKLRPSTYVLFSLCSTLQRIWWSKSGNVTASHQLFVTIYTGCSCVNEWTLRFVYSSTNVCTSLPQFASCHFSPEWRQSQLVGICGSLMPVIWPHREQELSALVHEVSRLLAHQCGTICRRSSRLRHWPLDISSASWRQWCLLGATTHQRSCHNFWL